MSRKKGRKMSKRKFKIGDKVRCTHVGNNGPDTIILNGIYEVIKIHGGFIEFINESGTLDSYGAKNFELVESNAVGRKNDQEKPDLSLIPTDALWGMASALTYGAKKYDRHNFRNGLAYSRLVAATMRHLSAWNEGEEIDRESGLNHLDHAMASLAMLKFMTVNKQDMDDRWLNLKSGDT